jgi:MFS transporter, DHA1 family, multidrug resistance protein
LKISKPKIGIPLALLTAVGMLSSDLYLPALPSMSAELGACVVEGQSTMAVYMFSLALSQLGWGWAADHYGDRKTILAGTWLLIAGSALCAVAQQIDVMLLGRLLQGLGSGAATVAVPAIIRRRFSETEAVGALALVASLEAIVPAGGPVLGVAFLALWDWRASFVVIAGVAFILLFFVNHIIGNGGENHSPPQGGSAIAIIRNGQFLRHCLAYACMFGALLMIVASGPYLVTHWYARPIEAFAVLQICGVAGFMFGARYGARQVSLHGVEWMVRRGTMCLAACGFIMLACALADFRSMTALVIAWVLFCYGLGLRGPSSMSRALSLATEGHGKAAGVMMFIAFAGTSLATMAAAPFLEYGLMPLALLLLGLVVASALLVPELMMRPRGEAIPR